MSTRLNPAISRWTSGNQHAYRRKASTVEILLSAESNQIREDDASQLILVGFLKDFDNIAREILRDKLYEAGLPRKFARLRRMGRGGNKLREKCDRRIGKCEINNNGVPHGRPHRRNPIHNIWCANDDTI